MKLCLGVMITAGEAPYLRLHLPHIAQCFDKAVIVSDLHEDVRTESNVVFDLFGWRGTYVGRIFDNNWSAHFNMALDYAELDCDAILRLDPDETMFAADIDKIRELLETYPLLYLSRINFWGDRLHYSPQYGHDYQGRAWLLNRGIRLGGKHHEGVVWPAGVSPKFFDAPDVTIYHYGDVGRERILKRDLHYLNVAREQAGHPPLSERPADREFPTRHNIVYNGPQPIDPETVGIYAPWTE